MGGTVGGQRSKESEMVPAMTAVTCRLYMLLMVQTAWLRSNLKYKSTLKMFSQSYVCLFLFTQQMQQ